MPARYACALITGASAGLGEEFARQLAPRASTLVLVARREERLNSLAMSLAGEFPSVDVRCHVADLTDPAARRALANSLQRDGLAPDLLVNNAGMGDYGEFSTSAWPKVESMLRLNVEALTHLTHLLLPAMIRARRGAVVNLSSLASVLPIPDFAVYAATKAYVTGFSEALRIELKEYGIPVLAVCPGPVHTEFGLVSRRTAEEGDMPMREWFYVPCEQVVAEALTALDRKAARVYPGWKVAVAAALMGALPIIAVRAIMGFRPRRKG